MSSRVIIKNSSGFQFKISSTIFSDVEKPLEKFWENESSESGIHKDESIILGKLIHPDKLPNSANIIVSIILSFTDSSNKQSSESFLILKLRIKNSKTGEKIYGYASSFPERLSFTKPYWCKGNSKNFFITKFFEKILQISYKISWTNNITFAIESLHEIPIFCKFQLFENKFVVEDFYENQWKSNSIGHNKYSPNPISALTDRPRYSTIDGHSVLPKRQIMPPTALWSWADDWCVDDSLPECQDGWIYVDDWKSSSSKFENSTKFRFRRWIRNRVMKKDILHEDNKYIEFISNRFKCAVSVLEEFIPPFLKVLKREVMANPKSFDFRSIAAIPSPRLRRELQLSNT